MKIELPPLPPTAAIATVHNATVWGFTADQMQEYARTAVLAERERIARLVDDATILNDWDQRQLVTAIRGAA